MAILCIRVATNPGNTVLRTQPGDVVCIMEDGHVFSNSELNCGQYRFISVPTVRADAFNNLRSIVFAVDGVTPTRIRGQQLDSTVLSAGVWRIRTVATKAQIDSITITRN